LEVNGLIVLRHEVPALFPARLERGATVGTPQRSCGTLGLRLGGTTEEGRIFEHPRSHASQTLIQRRFNFAEGRLRVLQSPFFHTRDHFFREFMPAGIQIFHTHGNLAKSKFCRL
jgi:hypothetical protein